MAYVTALLPQRQKTYRRAMMDAIREAAAPSALMKGTSLTFGLRCIRIFESVNGITFDPFNSSHREKVGGRGAYACVFWRVRRIWPTPPPTSPLPEA